MVPYEELTELDKWALIKLDKLIARVTKAYDNYEFHIVFHSVHNFCTTDLSNIYFDILKDKLYCSDPNNKERRAAQTVLYKLINALVVLLTPVLAFTTEEIWRYLRKDDEPISVQLLEWPQVAGYKDDEIENRIDKVLEVREVVTKALEEARTKKIIGHSLGAWVTIYAENEWADILNKTSALDKIFIVSKAEVADATQKPDSAISLEDVPGIWVEVKAAEGEKCERCWIIDTTVGTDATHPTLCHRCSEVVEHLSE